MTLKRYLTFALWGCLLVSCGDSSRECPVSGVPIRFSCDVLTRGTVTTGDNIASMGVTAFLHSADFDADSPRKPNFMIDQSMEKIDGSWTYAPVKYWPEGSDVKISFFAYSPHSDKDENGLSLDGLQLSYNTPGDSQKHPDLLVATPLTNQTDANSTFSFTFAHMLARVSLIFEGDDVESLSDIKLSGIKTQGSISLNGGTWTIDESETGTVSYTYNIGEDSDRDYMMLLPQTLTSDVKLSYTVGESTKEAGLSTYGVAEWKQGQAYSYRITIEK